MTPIADEQRKQIFALCRELGWSDQMRREMIREWTNKTSLAADAPEPLSRSEAHQVIENLRRAVMMVRRERRSKGIRQRRIWRKPILTPEQLRKLDFLRRTVFRGYDAGFSTWLSKRYGVASPDQLTIKQASAAIVGLERMKAMHWHPKVYPTSETPTLDHHPIA